MINSGMKLARQFFNYSPQFVGLLSEDVAYITFTNPDQMDQFITAAHGLTLPTGDVLVVQRYSSENSAAESENRERKEKQEKRERKRLERTEGDVQDLESLFCPSQKL